MQTQLVNRSSCDFECHLAAKTASMLAVFFLLKRIRKQLKIRFLRIGADFSDEN